MDNGTPWGTQSNLPSALALWLVGLGIMPVYGRPAHSTDNGIVERHHGVLAGWVEPQRCANFADCQQRLLWAVHTQRERYALPGEYTRREAYPALYSNVRRYCPQDDAILWQVEAVRHYLAQRTFQRQVEVNGRVTLFANAYSVGRAYARQPVSITLDAHTSEWQFTDAYNRLLRRHPAKELTYEQISQLQLAKRRR